MCSCASDNSARATMSPDMTGLEHVNINGLGRGMQ